jgi:hypothetical protein
MNMTIVRKALVAWLLIGLVGMGAVRPAQAILDKTRFVADLGIAYYCFHHWVSKPYKGGEFQNGSPHRTKAVIKAGAALLFALNRVKAANKIAHTSKDPLLHKFGAGLDAMTASVGSIGQRFKSGKFNPSDLGALNGSFGAVNGTAMSNGLQIKDVSTGIPNF